MDAKNIPQVCGVYAIVNIKTHKRYIGSSISTKKRWLAHRLALRKGIHHSCYLQRVWNKYGEDAFIFVVLEECNESELIQREQFYIDHLADYNTSPTAGNCTGVKHSDATKSKQSARMLRIMATKTSFVEHITTLSKGRPKPEKWKRKLSERLSYAEKPKEWVRNMAKARAVIPDELVLEICSLRLQGVRLNDIAAKTGVSWSQVQRIISGERYANVEGRPPLAALKAITKRKEYKVSQDVFHFVHKEHGERICTKKELQNEFNTLKIGWITEVCAGRKLSTQGWGLNK